MSTLSVTGLFWYLRLANSIYFDLYQCDGFECVYFCRTLSPVRYMDIPGYLCVASGWCNCG